MKKLFLLIFCLFPLSVFAYSGPLSEDSFYINNQTTQPFHLTINSNSSTTATFHLVWDWYHAGNSNLDLPGSYLFFSIVSDKKIDIDRNSSFGSGCNNSCFSNDDYLQLVDDSSGYSYVYYFNIVKWQRNVGTQVDLFNVDDVFKFTNKESGTANVYIYGAYADTTNQIPQYINDTNTLQEIIIGNERQTQEIIDSNKVCLNYDKVSIKNDNYFLGSSGNPVSDNNYGITDYIKINSNTTITLIKKLSVSYNSYACFYNINKSYISCVSQLSLNSGQVLTIPNNADYIRFTIVKSYNEPQWNICNNGNQVIVDKQDETNNKLDDLNDNIISNDIDNPNSDFSDMEDMIAHNGVITNLIGLPITLYTSILNALNQSCSEYNFGQLFGSDLKFQCINLGALLGNTIWGVIDVLFSGFTIYAISKKMIKVFNNFSGLNEGDVIDD